MAVVMEPIAVALPGVRAFRWSSDAPYSSMKEAYAIGRVVRGRSAFRVGRNVWESGPGMLQLKQPGDVHRDVAHDGNVSMEVVAIAPSLLDVGHARLQPLLAAGDPRGAALHRLQDALFSESDALTRDVALVEALNALAGLVDAPELTRPVRRAQELLLERFADAISLDELATHADLDKFRLCRAFRVQVGLPPHAYQTRLRIAHAKARLAAGERPSEVAQRVGFYDQAQLTRHFRKATGTTPARYALRASALSRPRSPGRA